MSSPLRSSSLPLRDATAWYSEMWCVNALRRWRFASQYRVNAVDEYESIRNGSPVTSFNVMEFPNGFCKSHFPTPYFVFATETSNLRNRLPSGAPYAARESIILQKNISFSRILAIHRTWGNRFPRSSSPETGWTLPVSGSTSLSSLVIAQMNQTQSRSDPIVWGSGRQCRMVNTPFSVSNVVPHNFLVAEYPLSSGALIERSSGLWKSCSDERFSHPEHFRVPTLISELNNE